MIWLDFESFRERPISDGTYKYTTDCEVLLATYAFDDGPVKVWDKTLDPNMPADLHYALTEMPDELITAHSSMFDRHVLEFALGIPTPRERWRDTLVQALSHGLPGGLDKLCAIFKLDEGVAKKKTGKQLIQLFCKPRPKNMKVRRATRLTHPEEWQDFIDYAVSDVAAMRELAGKMPTWNYTGRELELWHLDQKINDRGFAVDLDLANSAITAITAAQKKLAARTQVLTDYNPETGEGVKSTTQRDKLLEHLLEYYGVALPDLQADTLERRINDPELPIELRELLAIRLQATTSSTSKYRALLNGEIGGRLYGTAQFNGAMRTGRWAHRQFQPGNMPRPNMKQWEIDEGIEAIKGGYVDLLHGNVMRVASNAIRGCIIAPPGRKLCVSDLSNIEGRAQSGLAGEHWKLDAFRAYDTITGYNDKGEALRAGPDLYKLAYAKSFRVDHTEVDKDQRQIGKVQELMLGYGGGVGAYITGAATYGIDLTMMAENAFDVIPTDVLTEARGFYEWTIKKKRNTFGLTMKEFMVCESFVLMWRAEQPAIASYWKELEEAARLAIRAPGEWHLCRALAFRRDGAWLRMRLPSGRSLCYPSPQIDDKGGISYMGVNQYTRKWSRIRTYGGKFLENACQGVARDVMTHNMPTMEAEGYEVVLTVHDEVLGETPDTPEFSSDLLGEILSTVPPWAEGWPLSAGGFETHRYRKD